MRILEDAKAFSHRFCVALALLVLPANAYAVPDGQSPWSSDVSGLDLGHGVSGSIGLPGDPAVVGVSDKHTEPFMMTWAPSVFVLGEMTTIDEAGWGYARNGSGEFPEEAPIAIPGPGPLAILGLAIFGLGFFRLRRRI